ncbi:accessory Sec system glycosyltransferase Asp1 [Leuconostoc pseudomesenteroides]|uniref:accessory Sec system glycosyltransferase Asp1 n=1 Tax=Leuconostoc pseudomesenteroides TaxID=33968 RepID=UPI0039EC44D8
MIYFLTDWHTDIDRFESNIMLNTIKVLKHSNSQIINLQAAPFMHYLVNYFGLPSQDNFSDLLDVFLDVPSKNTTPTTLTDLKWLSQYEKYYTNKDVTFSNNGVVKGRVYFNQWGFVSQVEYISSNSREIDIYSHKGYVSSKNFYDAQGEKTKWQVYDEQGQVIFTEYPDCVIIAEAYGQKFSRDIYTNYGDLFLEMLSSVLSDFNPRTDRLIIDAKSPYVSEFLSLFPYLQSLVLIYSGHANSFQEKLSDHFSVVENIKQIMTDNVALIDSIRQESSRKYQHELDNISYLPFYATSLNLGESNSAADQNIYWQVNRLDKIQQETLVTLIEMKLKTPDLCLIVESQYDSDKNVLNQIVSNFVSQYFEINLASDDYQLVKQYHEAQEQSEMTPMLREAYSSAKKDRAIFAQYIKAYLFKKGFRFRYSPNKQQKVIDFNIARLFVDSRDDNEYFSHALAVSAGIPIVSFQQSPYLINEKNGYIVQDSKQLIQTILQYVSDTDTWNQNLVASVDVIEMFGEEELSKKWWEKLV